MARAKKKRIAILIEDIFEDQEAMYPYFRFKEAGCDVVVVGPEKGKVYKSKHGYPLKSDIAASSARAAQFDGVIVPGGYAPDKMRRYPRMVKLVADIDKRGGLVASICHGPWVLAEADILRGRKATCVGAIKTDIVNAGARFVDKEVVVDGNLITSRTPPDLPAMMQACLKFLGIK